MRHQPGAIPFRQRLGLVGLVIGLGGALATVEAIGQIPAPTAAPTPSVSPDLALRQLLSANPLTAPYQFTTTLRNNRVVLSGRVATKQVHDVAIQTAIQAGIPVVDNLVIDTAEAVRALPPQGPVVRMGPSVPPPGSGFFFNTTYGAFVSDSGIPYLYPSPLFGRLDDPLFGLEPPAISYPSYWGVLSTRRLTDSSRPIGPPPAATPVPGLPESGAPSTGSGTRGQVEMLIDPNGVALLRGTVPTMADKILIGQRAAQVPGITSVRNELSVREAGGPDESREPAAFPPPAAQPPEPPPAASPPVPPASGPVTGDPVTIRLNQALTRDARLAGIPLKATVRDGVATLSGKLPSVVEAMRAFRAAQQTPGIREVIDQMEFPVPEDGKPNPLIAQGAPEDVEAYLLAQIRRQVGDAAHIDRVRIQGDRLAIRGRTTTDLDRLRVEAILRSMAILRGLILDPSWTLDNGG